MRKYCLSLILSVSFLFAAAQNPYRLWYTKPAVNWNEALPVGNGRLAAMVFGGTAEEKLQMNEETIWAGEPGNNIPERDYYDSIRLIRSLLFEGRYREAQAVSNNTFPRNAPKDGNYGMQYQPAGNLLVRFPGHEHAEQYSRELDIRDAVTRVSYRVNSVTYTRETIASLADNVIMLHISADRPKSISCEVLVNSPHVNKQSGVRNGKLFLSGTTSDAANKKGRIRFEMRALARPEGGQFLATDSSVIIRNADALTIYISIATNFKNYHDISADAAAKAESILAKAVVHSFKQSLAAHTAIYRRYFDRVHLDIGTTAQAGKPTDMRIAEFGSQKDPQLVSLYFQFGRYLMISGSQPGSQPTNLQGKWNDKLYPPWSSKYTVNINTEMNYWPAEVTNLPELHQPLFGMLKDLLVTGRESAAKIYHARGWNIHHNTDLWRISGPVDGGFFGMWPMGGAWLSQHIWYHYLFSGDLSFLKEMYPVLKGAAMFYADVLQEEPVHKWLVVAPSISPENTHPGGAGIAAGTTMDNQLVFDVFSNAITAAGMLHTDAAFTDTLRRMRERLAPMQVGQYTQLQEWMQDWDRPDDKHRHVSHLYGLYPGNQVSPYRHPELFEAARNSLVMRGDKSTGWSMGWKVNLWARLLDGNRAYKLISDQLSPAPVDNSGQNGGTYPNLFDAHPPFQIDGNFGCTSGIAEMLVQSHDGAVHILPALPDAWPDGDVEGLVTRGGFIISICWAGGVLKQLRVRSTIGGNCRLRLNRPLGIIKGAASVTASGKNPNPLFAVPDIKQPLLSEKARPEGLHLPKVYEYDISTSAGKDFTVSF
jgi:alpha-L-fucosidase 2